MINASINSSWKRPFYHSARAWRPRKNLLYAYKSELGTRHFLALWQRHPDNVIELQWQEKMLRMLWSRCLNGVATTMKNIMQQHTNFVAWKHGHVVAAVLSRALLCYTYISDSLISEILFTFVPGSYKQIVPGDKLKDKNKIKQLYVSTCLNPLTNFTFKPWLFL